MRDDVPRGANVLDDPVALRRFDPAGMLGQVGTIPQQVRDGWSRTRALTLPAGHRAATSVALLGMGGSAIAGDLVGGIFEDRLTAPLVVVRDYALPAWIGPKTFVVASSYSGATEETLAALEAGLRRRCPVVILTTDGPLLEMARRAELPHVVFPGAGQPRAAIGFALTLLAGVLERAGLLSLQDGELEPAAAAAERAVADARPETPTNANIAKQVAWSLVDRLPIVLASGGLASVARRWKTQLNENGKSAAVFESLPEATHNAIVGFDEPESIRERTFVVFLQAAADHPRNALRARLSAERLDRLHVDYRFVKLEGPSQLAQALQGVVIGDYVSVYLAALYGLDPTPVTALTEIKARLAETPIEDAG